MRMTTVLMIAEASRSRGRHDPCRGGPSVRPANPERSEGKRIASTNFDTSAKLNRNPAPDQRVGRYTGIGRTRALLVFLSCTISHTDPINRNGEE
jgi:hypothetical protein